MRRKGRWVWQAKSHTLPRCGARASQCRCGKPGGHEAVADTVHRCDDPDCYGAWVGDYEDDSFRGDRLAHR